MSREEAIIDIRDNIKPVVGGKSLDMAIEALEQEPCENAISRQAVLGIVDSYSESQSNVEDVTQDIISDIVVLPPVKPQEPKIGHWEWQTEDIYRCSECGEDIHVKEVMNVPQYKCCPMCLTKMVDPQKGANE